MPKPLIDPERLDFSARTGQALGVQRTPAEHRWTKVIGGIVVTEAAFNAGGLGSLASKGTRLAEGPIDLIVFEEIVVPEVGVHGVEGSFLGEVDKVLLQRLKLGADIEVPAGTTGIRSTMSDLTRVSDNEVALLRMQSGRRIIRMGGPTSVPVGKFVDRVIAHTHPSGRLKFSGADLRTLRRLGQRSSVIIDPRADMGARLLVPPLGPTP